MARGYEDQSKVSGRLRDYVYRRTKYGTVIAEYNSGTYENMKWSDKQKQSHTKFRLLTKLAQVFRPANDLGFKAEMKYTSQPCFVRHNYSTLIAGENGDFRVDYTRICMSHGTLVLLENVGLRHIGGRVEITWEWDSKFGGVDSNRVAVMLYCPDYNMPDTTRIMGDGVLLNNSCFRRDKLMSIDIPEEWGGLQIYCYIFTFDSDGRSSDSQFVGEILKR